jgi:RNA polymerase sigma factor (sigma-70 family)
MSESAVRPLTPRQSRRVIENLPLVYHHLRKQLARGDPRLNELRDDLAQEGCLALTEAVRRHRPRRHGRFGPYAVTKIHHAMSAYLRDRRHAIRVPLSTQYRRAGDRHAPRVPRMAAIRRDGLADRHRPDAAGAAREEREAGVTIGVLIRARIEAAVAGAREEVIAGAQLRRGAKRLVDGLIGERLLIPEPEARTSFRDLERRLRVSHGRLTHTAERLARRAGRRLRRDAAFRYLRMLARRSPRGMDSELTRAQRRRVRRALGRIKT